MPQMTAITVKKFDGTTDIVYAIKSAAAGDGAWASWRQDAGNTFPPAARPVLMHRVTESARGVRRVDIMYTYPFAYTDTSTGQVVISPLAVTYKNGVLAAPQGLPTAVLQEAGAQFANLIGNFVLRGALADQTSFY